MSLYDYDDEEMVPLGAAIERSDLLRTAKRGPLIARDQERWDLLGRVHALGGICDSFCRYTLDGAAYRQPTLTVGALLCLGSAILGRRLQYRGALSSLYVVNLAASGTGKDRPQSALQKVLDATWPAVFAGNSLASYAAMADQLKRSCQTGVSSCFVVDEYGSFLKTVTGKNAAAYRAEIKGAMTELWTRGPGLWSPAVSLSRGGGAAQIYSPVVTVLGSTVPENFHAAVSHDETVDGLLGRHIFFDGIEGGREFIDQDPGIPIPSTLIDQITAIRERHSAWYNSQQVTMSDKGILRGCDAVSVSETAEAAEILVAYRRRCDLDLDLMARPDVPGPYLARLPQHACRVAFILAGLRGGDLVVDGPVMSLAIEIAEHSAAVLARSLATGVRPTADSTRSQIAAVRGAIRALRDDTGTVPVSAILSQIQDLSHKQINEAIARLEAQGEIGRQGISISVAPGDLIFLLVP